MRNIVTPSSRRSYGDNVASTAWGARHLISTQVDGVSDEAIVDVSIPNGIPLVYSFDRFPNGALVPHRTESSVSAHVSGAFLEERGLLRAALEAEAELVRRVPGHLRQTDQPAVRALAKLELERKLIDLAADPSRLERAVERSRTKPAPAVDALYMGLPAEKVVRTMPRASNCQPRAFAAADAIVILRHGRTEHNKLGLFTGWEDASLAKEGIAEAKRAGQLLRARRGVPSPSPESAQNRKKSTHDLVSSTRVASMARILPTTAATRETATAGARFCRRCCVHVVALARHRDGLARAAGARRALGADHQELAAQRAHVRRAHRSQQEGDPRRARC